MPISTNLALNATVMVNRSGTRIPVYSTVVQSEIHTGGVTAGGTIIAYIEPNSFYTRWKYYPNTYVTCLAVNVAGSNNTRLEGFIEPNRGVTLGDYAWEQYQEPFHYYNSNGSSLVSSATETINGTTYRVFTVTRNLPYVNCDNEPQGVIEAGMKLATRGSIAGQRNPNYMRFSYYGFRDMWIRLYDYVDINGNIVEEDGYVDLGYEYGASPSTRAIR